jgi:t-SNARE complex subunit (syntaxin)
MDQSQPLDQLKILINYLKKINGEILSSVDSKKEKILESERANWISRINEQCIIIKPTLHTQDGQDQFIELIRKYVKDQEKYRDQKKELFATQLLMRNPNVTQQQINSIIDSGVSDKNILCLMEATDVYNCVVDRHKAILKVERDIEEIKELMIGMHALVMIQGEKIDRIADHTGKARDYCQSAEEDLTIAYKIKNRRSCLLF